MKINSKMSETNVAAEEMTAQAVALREVVADLEAMVGSDRSPEANMLLR